jgi:serine/threonine protein kinase/WD40 repeat protein
MSSSSFDDERPPGGVESKSHMQHDGKDTLPDISMEDTDAAAQKIPEDQLDRVVEDSSDSSGEGTQEPRPSESFTGAPTITPATFLADDLPDFVELASVEADSYVFGAEIARGGMGRILSARDRRTGRDVAIKEILPPLMAGLSTADKDGLVARFQREAHVTARLQHPSIVPVYEIGNFEGRPFFAMKKVDGEGLDEIIKSRATLAERLELLPTIVSLADALAYAHGQRVIHRDLKSSNILVGAFGETVVIDWGLAKDLTDEESDDPIATSTSQFDSRRPLQTVAGAIFGTPHYMPPEQARGDTVDETADVYAIGSILYHLLSGRAPYQDSEKEAPSGNLLQQLREKPPQALSSIVSDVPRDLLSIVDKAMSRDKSKRYPTAAELATDLADFTAGQRVAVHDYSTSELLLRWLRRHKTAVATGVVLLTALLVTATISMISVLESRDDATTAAEVAEEHRKLAYIATDEAMQFLAERGRIDFLEGRPLHSLVLLSTAFGHLKDRPAIKVMMAAAMRSIDALQMSLNPHDVAIASLVTSHDKTKLVSTGFDGEVRIWDMESGKILSTFWARSKWAEAEPSINSDGSKIVLPCSDGITVWNTATGEEIANIDGDFLFARYDHSDRIISIGRNGEIAAWPEMGAPKSVIYKLPKIGLWWTPRMSGDGKHLIVSLESIYIVDLETDKMRGAAFAFGSKLLAADVGMKSKRFVTGNSAGGLVLWNLNPLEMLATLDNKESLFRDIRPGFSPDGKLFASAAPNRNVLIYDVEKAELISSFDAQAAIVNQVIFAPDSKRLVTLGDDEIVRVWDVATGRLRTSFIGQSKLATAAVFSADGNSLFVSDSAGGISKWDASVDIVKQQYIGDSSYTAKDPKGRRVLIASGTAMALLDSHTSKVIAKFGKSSMLQSSRFSADGSRIFTGSEIYESRDGSLVRDLGIDGEAAIMLSINDDGSVVATSNQDSVRVWSVETGKLIYDTPGSKRRFTPIWLGPDGDYLLAMLGDFQLTKVDLSNGEKFSGFIHKGISRNFVTFLGKPNHVVVNRRPDGLDVVDVSTGEVVHTLRGTFNTVTVAPDGVRVFAATNALGVLWNSETGEIEKTITDTLARSIYSSAVSKDGHLLALASHNAVSVYDRGSGALILRASVGSEAVHGLVFGPDDTTLVVSAKHRSLVMDLHREARAAATIEALVRERVPRVLEKGHFLPSPSGRAQAEYQHLPGLLRSRRSLFPLPKQGTNF